MKKIRLSVVVFLMAMTMVTLTACGDNSRCEGTSQVAQWLSIHSAKQGTRVQALVGELSL